MMALHNFFYRQNAKSMAKLDIFHGLSNELPLNIQDAGIPSVVTIHDLIFKTLPDTYRLSNRIIYDLKFKSACKQADRVIAISESTKRDIIHYYNTPAENVEVVYQCVNPIYYAPNQKELDEGVLKNYQLPSEYLLYVGTIEARKNLKTILKAYAELPRDLCIPLVVVGRGGTYLHESRQLAQRLKLDSLIYWVDYLESNDHLKSVYQQATAFIYPSLYEGFGLPVVESLLSQTPVITSNTSSLPEAAGPDSLLVNPTDSDQMATAIKTVLTDSEKRVQMIERGYHYAIDHFSPKVVTQQMMNLYQQVQG